MSILTYLLEGKDQGHATGLVDPFQQAFLAMMAAAPPEVQQGLRIFSGYRSPEHQARLFDAAVKKYGSPAAARKWVAPPGRSQHNHGNAADLKFASPAVRKWVHENAGRFGLGFPMGHEPWHIELLSARGSQAPSTPKPPFANYNPSGWGPPAAKPANAPPHIGPAPIAPANAPPHIGPPPPITDAPAMPAGPMAAAAAPMGGVGGIGAAIGNALANAAGGMGTPNEPAMLSAPSGPLQASLAADQAMAKMREMKDFLLPNAEDVATSGKPIPNLFGEAMSDPQAAEGIFTRLFAKPKLADLGGGIRIRA